MMESKIFSLLVTFAFISSAYLETLIQPSNGFTECRKILKIPSMQVLPGGGWDNLRNLDMGRVMNLSYFQCQTTEDGTYFVPDEIIVIPQKISNVVKNSEIISSWTEYKSFTSESINAEASFFSYINGKFSKEFRRIKTHQLESNSFITRVQVRNHLYTLTAYPGFTLDKAFVQQVKEIADAIENNQTRQAVYLAEKMVLDYGTHVITSVDAGAILLDENYLKRSFFLDSQSSKSSISASAGVNFFKKFDIKLDGEENVTDSLENYKNYRSNITYSITMSHGGALYYPGITLQKWQESTLTNLIAIDRSGQPLHFFLTPSKLPDLPPLTVNKVAHFVYQAIERYYKVNTIPGCINPDSEYFNFQANVGDASCVGPKTNFSFGGVFQNCTSLSSDGDEICQKLSNKNPATGSYSCQEPYTATLLHSEVQELPNNNFKCKTECSKCWMLFDCCKEVCGHVYRVSSAQIQTYWCSTDKPAPDSGYFFGGLFGPTLQNPVTSSTSCPPNFVALNFLSSDTFICLSKDYGVATKSAVAFGGFFSCTATNPFADSQMRCPPTFSQYLLSISDGCEIFYCVQSDIFKNPELLPIHLPPFSRPPVISTNVTNIVVVMSDLNQTWIKTKITKRWKTASSEDMFKLSQEADEDYDQSDGKSLT